jgi:hypothetical protein
MAPKRSKPTGASTSAIPPCFLSSITRKHYDTVKDKGLIHEIGIDFHAFDPLPRVREIATGYGWMPFNNMLGECNTTWVEEFYTNAMAYGAEDYRSYVWGGYRQFCPGHYGCHFWIPP